MDALACFKIKNQNLILENFAPDFQTLKDGVVVPLGFGYSGMEAHRSDAFHVLRMQFNPFLEAHRDPRGVLFLPEGLTFDEKLLSYEHVVKRFAEQGFWLDVKEEGRKAKPLPPDPGKFPLLLEIEGGQAPSTQAAELASLLYIPFQSLGDFQFGFPEKIPEARPSGIRFVWNSKKILSMIFADYPGSIRFRIEPEGEPEVVHVQNLLEWARSRNFLVREEMPGFFSIPQLGLTLTFDGSTKAVTLLCLLSRHEFEATYGNQNISPLIPNQNLSAGSSEAVALDPLVKYLGSLSQADYVKAKREVRKEITSHSRLQQWKRPAWLPVTQPGSPGKTQSGFGGSGWIRKNGKRPKCGRCGAFLVPVFQLSSRHLPKGFHLQFEGMLQFFTCNDSDCLVESPDSSRSPSTLLKVMTVEDLKTAKPCVPENETVPDESYIDEDDIFHSPSGVVEGSILTKWKKTDDFPSEAARFYPDRTKEEYFFRILFPRGEDKLGEWPAWVQGESAPKCERCKSEEHQVFFMQLTSGEHTPDWWGDGGRAWFFRCGVHPEIFSVWWAGT